MGGYCLGYNVPDDGKEEVDCNYCGYDGSKEIWNEWNPPIYRLHFGWYSLTRGCTWMWICFFLPINIFIYYSGLLRFKLIEPCANSICCLFTMVIYYILLIIPVICLVIFLIASPFLWLFCYSFSCTVDWIMIFIYLITCSYCGQAKREEGEPKGEWNIFSICCEMKYPEWREGPDPFTSYYWEEWSPIRTLCNYNCPPV